MLDRLRRRPRPLRGVAFCEECGQVCTAECRGRAQVDRVRSRVALQVFPR